MSPCFSQCGAEAAHGHNIAANTVWDEARFLSADGLCLLWWSSASIPFRGCRGVACFEIFQGENHDSTDSFAETRDSGFCNNNCNHGATFRNHFLWPGTHSRFSEAPKATSKTQPECMWISRTTSSGWQTSATIPLRFINSALPAIRPLRVIRSGPEGRPA